MSLAEELKKVGAIKSQASLKLSLPVAPAQVQPIIETKPTQAGPSLEETRQTLVSILGPFLKASRERLSVLDEATTGLTEYCEQLTQFCKGLRDKVREFDSELAQYEEIYQQLEDI